MASGIQNIDVATNLEASLNYARCVLPVLYAILSIRSMREMGYNFTHPLPLLSSTTTLKRLAQEANTDTATITVGIKNFRETYGQKAVTVNPNGEVRLDWGKVDIDKLDKSVVRDLRELGYISRLIAQAKDGVQLSDGQIDSLIEYASLLPHEDPMRGEITDVLSQQQITLY